MKRDEIKRLMDRFLTAREAGKEPYFDADEFEELLFSLEESKSIKYYNELLSLGLRLHPESSSLRIRNARKRIYELKYEEALELLNSIGESGNQDLDTLKIECLIMLSQYSKAHEYLDKLIENKCEYLQDIFEYVATLLNDNANYKNGRVFIEQGLELFPDNSYLKEELGILCEDEGNLPEAIKICNELIDKNPFSYEHWFTLGRLYSVNDQYEKAVEAFDFALTCDESNRELKVLKAYCLYMNESYAKAIEAYEEIGKEESEAWEQVKPLVAECYMKLKDYQRAYELFHPMIYDDNCEKEPRNYVNFIHCCVETEREAEGIAILNKATKLHPDNIPLMSLKALTHLENGEESLAAYVTEELFSSLVPEIDFSKTDPDSLFKIGLNMLENGNPEKALYYLNRANSLKPGIPAINVYITLAFYGQRELERHEAYYNMLTEEETKIYHEELIRIYNKLFKMAFPHLEIQNPATSQGLIKDLFDKKENNN